MENEFCECGCGGKPNNGKRFISGHNGRGKRKKYAKHKCENCQGAFETMPHIKSRKFCSIGCRDAYRKKLTGSKNPMYNRAEMPCKNCGKPMQVTLAYLSGKKVGYCSKECGKEGFRKKLAMVKRVKNRRGKQAARIRDGSKCVLCGFHHVTAVHHITAKKNGGSDCIENLVTLCPNHHYMVHANMISREELQKYGKPFSYPEGEVVLIRDHARTEVNFRR